MSQDTQYPQPVQAPYESDQQPQTSPVEPQQQSQKQTNKSLGKGKTALIVIAVIVITVAVAIGSQFFKDEHHKQYATGTPYETTGWIIEADKDTHYSSSTHRRRTTYDIELKRTEPLPNGEYTYTSSESREYDLLHPYANSGSEFTFTIDEKGYLVKVQPLDDVSPDPDEVEVDGNGLAEIAENIIK